jgi:hypothetical protein
MRTMGNEATDLPRVGQPNSARAIKIVLSHVSLSTALLIVVVESAKRWVPSRTRLLSYELRSQQMSAQRT